MFLIKTVPNNLSRKALCRFGLGHFCKKTLVITFVITEYNFRIQSTMLRVQCVSEYNVKKGTGSTGI